MGNNQITRGKTHRIQIQTRYRHQGRTWPQSLLQVLDVANGGPLETPRGPKSIHPKVREQLTNALEGIIQYCDLVQGVLAERGPSREDRLEWIRELHLGLWRSLGPINSRAFSVRFFVGERLLPSNASEFKRKMSAEKFFHVSGQIAPEGSWEDRLWFKLADAIGELEDLRRLRRCVALDDAGIDHGCGRFYLRLRATTKRNKANYYYPCSGRCRAHFHNNRADREEKRLTKKSSKRRKE